MKQFMADASHELRAPVSLIRTTAEAAVQRRDRPAGEYLQALEEILKEAAETSQVVESLVWLARADSATHVVEAAPTDVCAVVRSASEQGEKLVRNRGSKFSAQIPEDHIWIQADAEARCAELCLF
jgi:signal transduction histidine kinase